MKKTNLILAIIFGLLTLGEAQHSETGAPVSRQEFITLTNSQSIKGSWYPGKWTTYRVLVFSDSSVYIDNHVDTVMTNKYSIIDDTLIIFGGQPARPYKNKILSLTDDTLILQGILETKEIRGYSRKKLKK